MSTLGNLAEYISSNDDFGMAIGTIPEPLRQDSGFIHYSEANNNGTLVQENTYPTTPTKGTEKYRSPNHVRLQSRLIPQVESIKQIWDGVVIDHGPSEITAKIVDLTNPQNPAEIVVFSTEEINESELPMLQNGAMFLWHIGYIRGDKLSTVRFSKIKFRRLPKWTDEDVSEAERMAKEYRNYFLTDTNNATTS